jgi:cysteine desulfuration protein SufE
MQDVAAQEGLVVIQPEIGFDDLVENFDLFDDWEDLYRYIIDLGRKSPLFPDSEKVDAHKVRGCMSQVWMVPGHMPGQKEKFAFSADSDAHIVKGLIHILAILYAGKTAKDIAAINPEEAFARLGLDQHLSPSRRNGLVSMVARLRAAAGAS